MDCCKHKKSAKKCMRKSDKKIFSLPRRFTRKRCKKGAKGFTMKASCAPYKGCKKGGGKKNKTKKGQRGAGGKQSRIVTDAMNDERSFLYDFLTEGDSWRQKYIQKHKYTDNEVLIWFAVESQFSAKDCKEKDDFACMNRHKTNEMIARQILLDRGKIPFKYIHLNHPAMGNEHLLDSDSQEYKDYYKKLKKAQEGVKEYHERNNMSKEEDNSYKYPIEIQIQKDEQSPPRKMKTPPRGPTSTVHHTPTTVRLMKLEEGEINESPQKKISFNNKSSPVGNTKENAPIVQMPFPPMGNQEV